MRLTVDKDKWSRYLDGVRSRIDGGSPCVRYLDLGGLKKVRLVIGDPTALRLIGRELSWILTDPVETPDAVIYLWKEPSVSQFADRLSFEFGNENDREYKDDFVLVRMKERIGDYFYFYPSGQINLPSRSIHFANGNEFFYGAEDFSPEKWISDGHVLVQMLFRIMNDLPDAKLVHGACVGVDGKGVLLCARGQKGKSTLAVSALTEGFDFVSEDYLLLEKKGDSLSASPLYSMMSLSPEMYDELYDSLGKARFIGVGPFKGKFLFDISEYSDQVRWHYPIKACVFPELSPDASEPRVELCGLEEKNRAITSMAHSTLFQMWSNGLKQRQMDQDFLLSVVRMLMGLDFYRIVLTPDIFKNAACLRAFIKSL